MSQKELAEQSGVSQTTISHFEQGVSQLQEQPSIPTSLMQQLPLCKCNQRNSIIL